MTIANLKKRISTGKRDDREKGLKMMRNILTENKKLESNKKRGFDDDFKVDDGKEKRRRRMDYRQRVLRAPSTMIHRGGWDCQNKPKSHESSEQDCLRNRGGRDCQNKPKNHECCGRNPGGRDCQDTKKTPLQKEKESCCRSDHCSSPATIDEGCTTSQLSPTKALRAAQMKKRYAHLIFKATHQPLLMPLGDPLKQQQEIERLEIAEKARIEEEVKAAQTLLQMGVDPDLKIQRQREREAAKIALDKMEKTVEFNDAMQIMRDFESLLNAVS
nr:transcription factor GTE12-like [Ipomoea batatas]